MTIAKQQTRRLETSISRRRLLQLGGLGMLNLSLPELLHAGAGSRGRPSGTEKSCIFIVQQGGPSHIDIWDLKPDAQDTIRGPFKPIASRVPGMRICELLPQLARVADRFSLIRSMTTPSGTHSGCMHMCLSGRSNPPPQAPYYGSILAKLRPSVRNVPSYVWLQKMVEEDGGNFPSGGFLGQAYAPWLIGAGHDNPSAPDFRVRAFDSAPDISAARLRERQRLLSSLEGKSIPAGHVDRLRERAFDMLTGPEARRAFDMEQEPPRLRERYGRNPLGQNLLLARRLIEAGVRLVSVHAWTGLAPGTELRGVNIWDGHGGVDFIGNTFGTGTYGLGFMLPRLDQAVAALLEDLEQRGRLQDTLVVMLGEFGRTPQISNMGREHWYHCASAMLAGGGTRGGVVYGASDKIGGYVKDSPVPPETFAATVFHALGVPPETRLSPDGFTDPVSTGQPIEALVGY